MMFQPRFLYIVFPPPPSFSVSLFPLMLSLQMKVMKNACPLLMWIVNPNFLIYRNHIILLASSTPCAFEHTAWPILSLERKLSQFLNIKHNWAWEIHTQTQYPTHWLCSTPRNQAQSRCRIRSRGMHDF